ncbi:unnamed protein product, partial [Prorocentrum cordatum]
PGEEPCPEAACQVAGARGPRMAPLDELAMDAWLQPGCVAERELDGCPFEVVVLQVRGDAVDVAYLDDGNVERDVPPDELSDLPEQERAILADAARKRFEDGLAWLSSEEGAGLTRPTTASSGMRWEQGLHVEEDGATILSAVAAVDSGDCGAAGAGAHGPAKGPEPAVTSAIGGAAACGAGLRGIRSLRQRRQPPAHETPAA